MGRRTRKFIGAGLMLLFVTVYAFCAMVTAEAEAIRTAPGAVQSAIYAVLGLAWILPLLPLIRWMERPDPEPALGPLADPGSAGRAVTPR